MADDKNEPANEEKLAEAFEQLEARAEAAESDPPEAAATPVPVARSGGGLGATLAIFLALVAIGIAAYPAYEMYQASQSTSAADSVDIELASLRSALVAEQASQTARLDGQIQTLTQRLNSYAENITENNLDRTGELTALREFVEQEMSSMRSRLGASAQDWVYAEVEYLIRMADQRVLMEGDAGAALQMLEAADKIVRQTDGLTAHGLRQALAQDIAALRGVANPDTQGIYLELAALVGQVPALEQKLPSFEAAPIVPAVRSDGDGVLERVMDVLRNAGARLASLVDFRRNSIEVQPILPPAEIYYLRQNLILKIQLAQLALLEGNEVAYQQALSEAAVWVADGFGEDTSTSRAVIDALTRLSAVKIAVVLPDISGSLREARRHLAAVHHRNADQSQNSPVADPRLQRSEAMMPEAKAMMPETKAMMPEAKVMMPGAEAQASEVGSAQPASSDIADELSPVSEPLPSDSTNETEAEIPQA